MTDDHEYTAYEHLLKALHHATKAREKFADGSKGESVADNTARWAEKSVNVAYQYLNEDEQ